MGDDSAPPNDCTNRLLTGGAEPSGAAFGIRERIGLLPGGIGERDEHELGDPFASADLDRLVSVIHQEDADLTPVPRVDQPGCVDETDPVSGSETGSR